MDHSNYLLIFGDLLTTLQHTPNPESIQRVMIQDLIQRVEAQNLDSLSLKRMEWIKYHLVGSDTIPITSFNILFGRGANMLGFEEKKELMIISLIFHVTSYQITWGWKTTGRNLFTFQDDPKKGIALLRAFSYCFDQINGDLPDDPVFASLLRIKDEVDTILLPLDQLFGEAPNASLFFKSLPKMISKIAFDNHPTLIRSYLPFLSLLHHWLENHPQIISFISFNIHHMNDALIEHFNSIIYRKASHNTELTFDNVAQAVASTPQRWNLEKQLGKKMDGRSEVFKENYQSYKEDDLIRAGEVFCSKIILWTSLHHFTSSIPILTPHKYNNGLNIMKNMIDKKQKNQHLRMGGVMTQKSLLSTFKKAGLQDLFSEVRMRVRNNEKNTYRRRGGELMDEEGDESECEDAPTLTSIPKGIDEIIEKILQGLFYLGLVDNSMASLNRFLHTLNFPLPQKQIGGSSKFQKRQNVNIISSTSSSNLQSTKKKKKK